MQYRTSEYAWREFDNYFFEKNLFGDIVAIYNEAGTKIGSYKYDAWGACTVSVESTASTLEKKVVRTLNPFRYRGYYFDTETGFYYLQSRYYNPQWGRFLNADGYINANGDLIGFNMYAYCSNNPVMYVDPTGEEVATWVIILIVAAVIVAAVAIDHHIHSKAPDGVAAATYENNIDGVQVEAKALYAEGGGPQADNGEMSLCDLDIGLAKGEVSTEHGSQMGVRICSAQAVVNADTSGIPSAEAGGAAAVINFYVEPKFTIGYWDITLSCNIGVLGAGAGFKADPAAGEYGFTPPTAGYVVPSFGIDFDLIYE